MLEGEVSKSRAEPESRAEDSIAPPIAVCVSCGLTSCAGCAGAVRPASAVAWEDTSQVWWRRLWRTALTSSLEPQRFFGQLPRGNVSEALAFALALTLTTARGAGVATGGGEYTGGGESTRGGV